MLFDLAIYALLALAVVMGFASGLLRSTATILGYVIGAPVALGVAPALSFFLATRFDMPPVYNGALLAGLLLVLGMIFAALLRRALDDVTGPQISIPDRIAGAALAPCASASSPDRGDIRSRDSAGRQPAFLACSQLRPYLSAAGQAGVKALPPEITAYIDRLKRERGI
jgi:membrane protein required for colicin V production